MFPEASKEFEKALSLRPYYLGYGGILTQNVAVDVTRHFRLWNECKGPGLEQALFEYLKNTKYIREYQLANLRVDLMNIYKNLTHVVHKIDENIVLATCQGLLLANKLNKSSDRLLWFRIQKFGIKVAESFDGDAVLPCVLFYLEELSETILSRNRRLQVFEYIGRPSSYPWQETSLQSVVDVVSFKLKEGGKFEAALSLCQLLLKFLDELEEQEDSYLLLGGAPPNVDRNREVVRGAGTLRHSNRSLCRAHGSIPR